VQIAAFQNPTSAERLVTGLRSQGFPMFRQARPEKNLHVVMAGPMRTYADAVAARDRLRSQYKDALVLP
jgi:cell division septation protein DedD